MDYVYPYTTKKPPVGEEVIAIIHSRSVRFGTYHVDYDICHVDENGNWHARLAGNFQGKRELLGVIDWDWINLNTEHYDDAISKENEAPRRGLRREIDIYDN